jgi:hypothetical protein
LIFNILFQTCWLQLFKHCWATCLYCERYKNAGGMRMRVIKEALKYLKAPWKSSRFSEPSPLAKGYGPSPLLSNLHTCMTSKNPGLADVYGDRFNWMQKTIAATNSECIWGSLHLVKTERHEFSFQFSALHVSCKWWE